MTLRIPQGVETGSRLRLTGKGEGGRSGGPAGDLYVVMHVREHALFERHGDDLVCTVSITFDVAALGGDVEVPTVDGFAKLRVSAGTPSGTVLRLRNKGVPSVDGRGHGDLHVRIVVEVPVKLSSKQKKLMKSLAEEATEKNYPQAARLREIGERFLERKKRGTAH